MSGLADAATREEAWFQADLSGLSTPLPALTTALGGPFTHVAAHFPTIQSRAAECLIWIESFTEQRIAIGGEKRLDYHMVATCRWPKTRATGKAEDDQTNFESALDKVLQRIRGLVADHTHGSRFWSVAESPDGIRVNILQPEQAVARGMSFHADIRWTATDMLTAI